MTLVSFSKALVTTLEAANILAERGISCEVINLRSLRPLDRDTIINSVMKTNHLVTVENGWPQYGIGAEIVASVMESECVQLVDILFFNHTHTPAHTHTHKHTLSLSLLHLIHATVSFS